MPSRTEQFLGQRGWEMVDKIKAGGVDEARIVVLEESSNINATRDHASTTCSAPGPLDNHDALSATRTEVGNYAEEGYHGH
jgi:hypothetical protein